MSLMMMLLIAWGVLTAILIILLIYRSTLSMHEEDQLFLDDADTGFRNEQEALQVKMRKITPIVRTFYALSGLLILCVAGMWIWEQVNRVY